MRIFLYLFSTMIKLCLFAHFFIQVASQKCGRPLGTKLAVASNRIVGGYDVGYYKYPWYAALIEDQQVACGGSLIGPRTVLTAAHCYKSYLEKNSSGVILENIYTVRLGMYNICISESTMTEYRIAKIQIHELYMSKKPYFDIALLILQESANQYEPVCLPTGVILKRPEEGTAHGMGSLRSKGPMPCTLHEARLLIYHDSACAQMILRTGNNPNNIKNAFCAGYLTGGIDTCQGDSGGPLQVLSESGQYTILGITSFGFECAEPGYLGMYTDVSRYVEWIKDKSESDIQFISPFTNHSDEEESVSGNANWMHVQYSHTPVRIVLLKNGKHKKSRSHKKTKRP